MPTYGYRCDACKHEFEEFQLITAPPLKKCPKCGKKKLIRLIGTGGAILFKGSGFYITDYRSDSYQKAAKSESSSSAPDSGDGASKSAETKTPAKESPAPKTEKKAKDKSK